MFRFHCLQVNNLSQRDVVISINVWVPILLNGVAVWDVALLDHSQVPACLPNSPESDPTVPHTLSSVKCLIILWSFLSH